MLEESKPEVTPESAEFSEAIRLDPNFAASHKNRGKAHDANGQQFSQDVGVPVPPISIKDNPNQLENFYRLFMCGEEGGHGELMVGQILALNPKTATEPVAWIATNEPAFWVSEANKERPDCPATWWWDSPTVMTTHISEMLKALAEAASVSIEPMMLAEYVRQHVRLIITSPHQPEANQSGGLALDPSIEKMLQQAVSESEPR